ncbi:unnamed protein product, partial [Rotaria sp. Silwood1]
ISIDNIGELKNLTNGQQVPHQKVSKSKQDAYLKDINRLRSIIKPMDKCVQNVSDHEIYALNGLTDPHPLMGILIMPSGAKGFGKAFMFVSNLPYKMLLSIGIGGLHKILALLVITYMNLNHWPAQKLLEMLVEKSRKEI